MQNLNGSWPLRVLVAKSIFVFGMYENLAQSEHLYGLRHQYQFWYNDELIE
jgi:hypothetical protein